jgi:catechol 2,3-dioxygenase-like lactoylglutathione lyase family enzyme
MTVKSIRHTGIVVSKMEASLRFYRDILEMEVWEDFEGSGPFIESLTQVPDARIWMIKLRSKEGGSIELLQYLNCPQDVPPRVRSCDVGCNHIALEVDNLDELYVKLRQEGIEFHAPPVLSPSGRAKVAYCRDPEGVILELVEIVSLTTKVGI